MKNIVIIALLMFCYSVQAQFILPDYQVSKVKSGDVTLQEAYNIVMSEVMNVSEMKGSGTKSNKLTLEKEFQLINKRYKPSIDDWIELLKKEFPFTSGDKFK